MSTYECDELTSDVKTETGKLEVEEEEGGQMVDKVDIAASL